MTPALACRFCGSMNYGLEGACDVCRPYAKINDHATHLWLVMDRPPNHVKFGVRLPLDITKITPELVATAVKSFAELAECERSRYDVGRVVVLVRQAPHVIAIDRTPVSRVGHPGYDAPTHNYMRCRFGFEGTPLGARTVEPHPGCVAREWPEGETLPEIGDGTK